MKKRSTFSKVSQTILPLVKQFIYKLKTNTYILRINSLNPSDIKLINDLSYFPNEDQKKKPNEICTFLLKYVLLFLKTIPLIHPYSKFILSWNIIQIILILIYFFVVPIEICFNNFLLSPNITIFFIILFQLNILISINTMIYSKGYLVKNRKIIMKAYVKSGFLIEIISLSSFFFISSEYIEMRLFRFLFFFRLKSLYETYRKLNDRFQINLRIHPSVLDLWNLFFFCFYILHIVACLWHSLVYFHTDDRNWMVISGIQDESVFTKYLYSLYWSAVTIMTVGYGDITPANNIEIIFNIFAIIFGCGLFAYFINNIGIIVSKINKERSIYEEKMLIINQYLSKKNINENLTLKIREFLRFSWQVELTQNAEVENQIIGQLSKSLKEELFLETNGYIINKMPMLYTNFSENFLRELIYKIKESRLIPEDQIFKEDTPDDCEVYFVLKGKVDIYLEDKKKVIGSVIKGQSFGEYSFFTGGLRTLSAKSKDFTTLVSIKRNDFLELIHSYPEDYEKFCMIKDQLISEKYSTNLQAKCFTCLKNTHNSMNCPLLHYIPNKIKIFKHYTFDPSQPKRNKFKNPRKKKRINARKCLNIIKFMQNKMQKNLLLDPDLDSENSISMDSLNYIEYNELDTHNKELMRNEINLSSNNHIKNIEINPINKSPSLNINTLTSDESIISPKLKEIEENNENNPNQKKKKKRVSLAINKDFNSNSQLKESIMHESCFKTKNKTYNSINYIKSFNEIPHLYKFEKMFNFKNYFPENNYSFIINSFNKKKKNLKKKTTIKHETKLSKKSIFKQEIIFINENENKSKKQKISQIGLENPSSSLEFTSEKNLEKKINRKSNIFEESSERKEFFKSNQRKINFYDVVNQVLYNNDLRNKLKMIKLKQKTIKEEN